MRLSEIGIYGDQQEIMKYRKPASKKINAITAYTGNLLFFHICTLLLQCKPCTLRIHQHYNCRTDTLLYWSDYFNRYEKEQKAIPHIMDKRACYLLIWLYNMCADYYSIDNDYGSSI